MKFRDMGSFAILNHYDAPCLPLKFVPIFPGHHTYMSEAQVSDFLNKIKQIRKNLKETTKAKINNPNHL